MNEARTVELGHVSAVHVNIFSFNLISLSNLVSRELVNQGDGFHSLCGPRVFNYAPVVFNVC